jgi:hypothetical protein
MRGVCVRIVQAHTGKLPMNFLPLIVFVPLILLAVVVAGYIVHSFRRGSASAAVDNYLQGDTGNGNPPWVPTTYTDVLVSKGREIRGVSLVVDPPDLQRAKFEAANFETTTQKELKAIQSE